MSKSYKVVKKTMNMGEKKGQTVYSVRPVSYGTLTTEEVAKQISTESTATTADVKAVLDRYAYYVVENLAKGYNSYHFYIRKDGTMTQHRFLLEVGAHARPFNRCSIGICYEGGLNEHAQPCDTRTPEQTERIVDVLSRLHRLFPKAKIVGHRDLPGTTPKECPCLDAHALFGWIEEL